MCASKRNVSESLENTINKFKTITTLLTAVLYLRGHNTSLSQTWTAYQRQDTEKPLTQHRLLDHLATVLVRDREVVAVAAGRERNTDISRAHTRDALSLSLIISVSHQGDTDIPVEGAEGAGTRYTTLSRDPQGKSNILEEEGDTDIDNADLLEAVGSTTLDAYNLRRQVVVLHAVDRLVGATPNFQDITHTVISVEHLGTDMWHWEDVVKEILVEDDAVRVETVLTQLRSLMQQDGMDAGGSIRRMCEGLLSPTPVFLGCVHCEGGLASILDERNLDKGLLDLNQVALHQELDDVQGVNLENYLSSHLPMPILTWRFTEQDGSARTSGWRNHITNIHEKAEIYFKAKLLDSIDALLKDKQQHVRTDSAQTDDYRSDADRKSQEVLRAKQMIDYDNLSADHSLWIH
ncbi:hypothetical protein HETIRDRAFT_100836 [Heterobasidion irregulare TC 32-1]|uniref:Uncharacterized protein n=1 Tax=Heterobasidion irregulare (strain TC 32-1) TaxID=747525 RepID=W4KKB8_HETIT|nr:uncharacterized protein HETIRDRAFT_100836 [Heterobasidion irregulare TC 32-1]ETW85516.1 hypothetical protein HETIRDRAFT_100836 [Heterobasidion irregulare TC 32-1]